jgi:hypothetical protein
LSGQQQKQNSDKVTNEKWEEENKDKKGNKHFNERRKQMRKMKKKETQR